MMHWHVSWPRITWSAAGTGNIGNVIQSTKIRHSNAFLKIQIFASVHSMHLKVCSVVISMLYCKQFSVVTVVDNKRSNKLALYAFLWWLKLHVSNYTIITYGYYNIQGWEKTVELSMKWWVYKLFVADEKLKIQNTIQSFYSTCDN